LKKILILLAVTSIFITALYLLFQNVEPFWGDLLNQVKDNPFNYASLSFIILVSDIVLPVPSSIIMYSNGAVLGTLNGALLSFISVILSSVIGYFIGRGSSAILKSEVDASVSQILEKYGYAAILISRGIPIISESVCIVCGFNKYNFLVYLVLNVIGYIPVCLIYAYFGNIAVSQNLFFISFVCSLFITFILWLLGKRNLKKYRKINAGKG
jgi:uncharacterized membrane protein YdjX (TVP38/TMEM64 family)